MRDTALEDAAARPCDPAPALREALCPPVTAVLGLMGDTAKSTGLAVWPLAASDAWRDSDASYEGSDTNPAADSAADDARDTLDMRRALEPAPAPAPAPAPVPTLVLVILLVPIAVAAVD